MQYSVRMCVRELHHPDIVTRQAQRSAEAINHAARQVLYEINGLPETLRFNTP